MRVAIIGVGRWGVNHVRVLTELMRESQYEAQIDAVKVVDTDIKRAKAAAEKYAATGYTDNIDEVVSEGFDAAIVAVPTLYHYKVVMKLLPHMHVMVEKPIASSLREAKEMIRLAEKEGRILAVGHIERFNPVIPALKDRLRGKEDGIKYIAAERIGPGPARTHTYNLGVAHDLLVHDVDAVNYLLEDIPVKVYATAVWEANYPYETEITALYTFNNGIIASLRASWRTGPSLKKRSISIQLENEIIEADYILQTIRVEKGLAEHASRGEYTDIISTYTSRVVETWSMLGVRKEPLLLEDLHFLQCLKNGKQPINNGEIGLKALKCILRALESAKLQSPVKIDW